MIAVYPPDPPGVVVMSDGYFEGKHYRKRAEECRKVARVLATVETRGTNQQFCYLLSARMRKVAADYEQMAEIADRLTVDTAEFQVQSRR
jgi:hypothetical protein